MKTAHDYMIALPEAERSENVKAMVNIMLLDAENDMDDAYAQGFEDGMNAGGPE